MGNYLIGIGGTGARCVEALVHIAAAGLLNDDRLYTLFVDPDRSNGNLDRAQVTLDDYLTCSKIDLHDSPLFRTPIRSAKSSVWSPFDRDTSLSLGEAMSYDQMRTRDESVAGLFDVLYSEEEKQAELDVGFRGHPSIGAAVFARSINLAETEPWTTFRQLVNDDVSSGQPVRVFLMGSIFGGTGAAGVPTIGKLVKDELHKEGADFEIGSALALPYFNFSFEGQPSKELKANSSSFIPNTKAALKYYHQKNYAQIFNRLYLLGDLSLSPVDSASLGGREQKNEPHFIELLAALAAADFFRTTSDESSPVSLLARAEEKQITWDDLPYGGEFSLSERLLQMKRFAFAYLSTYYPAIQHLRQNLSEHYAYPWYIDFFERGDIDLSDDAVKATFDRLKLYSEKFLNWISQIHLTSDGAEVNLISHVAVTNPNLTTQDGSALRNPDDFLLERFSSMGAEQSGDENGMHRLWEYMCSEGTSKNLSGPAAFVNALYEGCDKRIVLG